jgi:thioredoxin 1
MDSLQSEEHFDQLLADHTYVFINVSAKWCKPCKAIQPQIFELIPQYKNIKFTVLDVDKLGDLADKLEVGGVPTFILMKNGKIRNKVTGANLDGVKRMLSQI